MYIPGIFGLRVPDDGTVTFYREIKLKMGFGVAHCCLKKNQNAPRPSEHPPVIMGKKMSKRLGGIKGCKYKTSSWHLNRFLPDADNIGSTV